MNLQARFRALGFGMVEVLGVAIVFRRNKVVITYDLRHDKIFVKGELEPEVEALVEELRENKGDIRK